jgi:hypothetical protein
MKPLAVEVTQFREIETDLASESVYSDSARRMGRRRRDTDDMDAGEVRKSIASSGYQ